MTRCPNCPAIHACLPPDGPETSPYLFVLEAPGYQENDSAKRGRYAPTGRILIGKSGQECDQHYFPLAGLNRGSVRIINSIACLPPNAGGKLDIKDRKDRELLESCANHHLYPEIRRNHYRLIIPMGTFACYAIDPAIDLDIQHGIPFMSRFGMTFPMYHPAGGIHEPKKMLHIRTDWDRLRRYLRGTLHIPVDEYPTPDYREVEDVDEIYSIDPTQPLACDTETKKDKTPFCLTYSTAPGMGRLIRAANLPQVSALQEVLDTYEADIYWHNWLFDFFVTKKMGLRFPRKHIKDTMVKCFHLGNVPQGLKALCKRELGMEMQDFDDLVTPYATPLVLRYYREAYDLDCVDVKPPIQMVLDKNGEYKEYKPQRMKTKLKRFFTDYTRNSEKDVFKMWTDNWEYYHEQIEYHLGPWPGKCISQVPFDEALYYACRDADGLLRLAPILHHMKSNVRKTSQENWRN